MQTVSIEVEIVSQYFELVEQNENALSALREYERTIYSKLNDNEKIQVYLSINPNEKLLSKIYLARYIHCNLSHLRYVQEWEIPDNTIIWFEKN